MGLKGGEEEKLREVGQRGSEATRNEREPTNLLMKKA